MVDVFAMVASLVDESDVIGLFDDGEAQAIEAIMFECEVSHGSLEAYLQWEADYYGRA